MIPRETLIQALEECDGFRAFSLACKERVDLLEERKAKSDHVIADQEMRILTHKDEVEALKRQRNVLTPIGAAILGIAIGIFYQSKQE